MNIAYIYPKIKNGHVFIEIYKRSYRVPKMVYLTLKSHLGSLSLAGNVNNKKKQLNFAKLYLHCSKEQWAHICQFDAFPRQIGRFCNANYGKKCFSEVSAKSAVIYSVFYKVLLYDTSNEYATMYFRKTNNI